ASPRGGVASCGTVLGETADADPFRLTDACPTTGLRRCRGGKPVEGPAGSLGGVHANRYDVGGVGCAGGLGEEREEVVRDRGEALVVAEEVPAGERRLLHVEGTADVLFGPRAALVVRVGEEDVRRHSGSCSVVPEV